MSPARRKEKLLSRGLFPSFDGIGLMALLEWKNLHMKTSALVTISLDYRNLLYMGLTLKITWELESVQSAMAL